MAERPLILDTSEGCDHSTAPAQSDGLELEASVGKGGVNKEDDVFVIQAALNAVPPEDGGPEPKLIPDGQVGPLTIAAIVKFQQKQFGTSDGRVDPDRRTVAALSAFSDGAIVAAKRRTEPRRSTPNFVIQAMIDQVVPELRRAIQAALFHLDAAAPHVGIRDGVPGGPFQAQGRASLKLIDDVFDLSRLRDARLVFDRMRTVYRNMQVALNRAFETHPLAAPVLFVANSDRSMEDGSTLAYTAKGGAFLDDSIKIIVAGFPPATRIYMCTQWARTQRPHLLSTPLHELAHYVSTPALAIGDNARGFFFGPKHLRLKRLRPEQKVTNAEHYAAFALIAGGFAKMPQIP